MWAASGGGGGGVKKSEKGTKTSWGKKKKICGRSPPKSKPSCYSGARIKKKNGGKGREFETAIWKKEGGSCPKEVKGPGGVKGVIFNGENRTWGRIRKEKKAEARRRRKKKGASQSQMAFEQRDSQPAEKRGALLQNGGGGRVKD